MDRGVRAIVSHRLPNAEELEAGCGDWLECCQAYIHAKNCPTDSARRAAEEIVDHLIAGPYVKSGRVKKVSEIISKHFAAAPADDDAESLPPQAQLPSPAQQALQIVTAWRAVVGGDDLLIHYIKQAIEENCATTTTKGDR